MTPKEKAKELIEKFIEPTKVPNIKHIWVEDIDAAKQCALISVNEILNESPSKRYWDTYDDETPSAITFWEEVKEEINKL